MTSAQARGRGVTRNRRLGGTVDFMATSTKSTGRARTTPARGTPARKPAARTTAQKTVKFAAAETEPGLFVRSWLALAHVAGAAARALGPEKLSKEERRDGLPFFLVLLAVAGAVVEWFLIDSAVARNFDAWTFGGLFGRVAFALPVILFVFAIWLFRKPSSVHDNGRIGIGLSLLLVSVSGLCHVYGGQPTPTRGMNVLALSGGVIGWMIAAPLIALTTAIGATAIIIVLLALSLLIITKTPPNRIGQRSRELYAWLFGAELSTEEERVAAKTAKLEKTAQVELDGVDGPADDSDSEGNGALPWWRRNNSKREEDPDFGGALVADAGERGSKKGDRRPVDGDDPLSTLLGGDGRGGFDSAIAPADGSPVPTPNTPFSVGLSGTGGDHYGTEVLEDLLRAEDAIKRFTGEIDVTRGSDFGLHDDESTGGPGSAAAEGLTEVLPGLEGLGAAAATGENHGEDGHPRFPTNCRRTRH
jgi:S-DNA-T family DNA segregation ATPase FtsK/SpoIIIE